VGSVINSYLSTRLELLASRLISLESLPEIIESDLEQLLKRFGCADCDGDTDSQVFKIHRKLIGKALQDFEILFRPFTGVERDLLNYAVHWYELSNLKTLIRGKFTGKNDTAIENELIDLESFTVLPLNKLLQADDPLEMMRLLEETPYSSIVRQARSIFEEEGQNLFSLDAAIDRMFFNGLAQRIRFLEFHDQQQAIELFGTFMDRLNLLWLMRYRFSYNLSPAKSYYLLATTGKKIHSGNLMNLAKLESLPELISQLPTPLNGLIADMTNMTDIENTMQYYVLSAAVKTLKYSPSVITRVFSYILIRESEIQFLHAVIKGKFLGFDEALIRKAVGGMHA